MDNDNFIKHLKPRKDSKYHQGVVNPNRLSKYYTSCKDEPVIYRSGLELDFINFCENNKNIIKWASEPIKIPYFNRLKNKDQNYYPDYVLETEKGEHLIVEIKPYNQTIKPREQDSRWLKEAWVTNIDKWSAAKVFAENHNSKFIVITEKFFK